MIEAVEKGTAYSLARNNEGKAPTGCIFMIRLDYRTPPISLSFIIILDALSARTALDSSSLTDTTEILFSLSVLNSRFVYPFLHEIAAIASQDPEDRTWIAIATVDVSTRKLF